MQNQEYDTFLKLYLRIDFNFTKTDCSKHLLASVTESL